MFSASGVASMISTIAAELEAVVPAIAGVAGVAADEVTKIATAVEGVKAAASGLADAESHAAAQPIMSRIVADVNGVLTSLANLPLPPAAGMVMRIVQVLVPTVIGIATIVWPATPATDVPAVEAPAAPAA